MDTCVAGILDSDALNRGDTEEDDASGMSSGVVVLVVFLVLACTAGCIAAFMYFYKGREPAEKIVVLSSVNPGFNPGWKQQRGSVPTLLQTWGGREHVVIVNDLLGPVHQQVDVLQSMSEG